MSFAIPRAVALILPILILPTAALGAPKVGTVTSSNSALVAHDGKVVPATANMPLYQGDKVMTLSGGSANVQLADKSLKLGGSSVVPLDDHSSIVSMDSKPSSNGGNWHDAGKHLAWADHDMGDDHGNHFGRCHMNGHGHDDGDDEDDDGGHGHGPGHGHGHNPHCPVSP
jgi:hypothetical protein